jgi:hypothetical protein
METESSIMLNSLFPNQKLALKRKRILASNKQIDFRIQNFLKKNEHNSSGEEDEEENGPEKTKLQKLDENMSDALMKLHLQLEIDDCYTKNSNKKISYFYLSDELKNSIKNIEREEEEFNSRLLKDLNSSSNISEKLMQIVPWIPSDSNTTSEQIELNETDINSAINEKYNETMYKVEEPNEKKKTLKRFPIFKFHN